jgi:hypothetical protein
LFLFAAAGNSFSGALHGWRRPGATCKGAFYARVCPSFTDFGKIYTPGRMSPAVISLVERH